MPKSSGYDPNVLAALRKFAPRSGDPLAFIATALIESGLNPRATGDSGHSFGLFQLNDRGRLASYHLTPQQAYDPLTNARVSADEFSKYAAKGLKGAQLALAAQRPANHSAYAAEFAKVLPQAKAILASADSGFGAVPSATETPNSLETLPAGGLDVKRLLMLLRNQRGRSLRGIMPAKNFRKELAKLVQGALAGAQQQAAQTSLGQGLEPIAMDLTVGGGPSAHGARPLGNWQSDLAYDLMGKPGEAISYPFPGTITRISGQPGGDPQFAGYGVTIDDKYFLKHLGALAPGIKVGAKLRPGQEIGTLDPTVRGGAHVHAAARDQALLDALLRAWGLKK
jgi:hypothetical protein